MRTSASTCREWEFRIGQDELSQTRVTYTRPGSPIPDQGLLSQTRGTYPRLASPIPDQGQVSTSASTCPVAALAWCLHPVHSTAGPGPVHNRSSPGRPYAQRMRLDQGHRALVFSGRLLLGPAWASRAPLLTVCAADLCLQPSPLPAALTHPFSEIRSPADTLRADRRSSDRRSSGRRRGLGSGGSTKGREQGAGRGGQTWARDERWAAR